MLRTSFWESGLVLTIKMGRLSVVIPAYNRAQVIGETLHSLLVQTLPADEIIVVDDGSTDNTAGVAARFGEPVRVIHRVHAGPAAARNTGLAASTGEFVHFFDSDDLAAPNKHAVQVEALKRTGADIAIGPWVKGRFSNKLFRSENHVLQQLGLPKVDSLVKALLTYWSFVPHSALFRRRAVEAVGGFEESLFSAEDQFFFLNCLLADARLVHTPGTLEFYRVGEVGKITENDDWSGLRIREWARFLMKARGACNQRNIEPLNWFGYRRRLWEAEQDLSCTNKKEEVLLSKLRILLKGRTPKLFYRWHRAIGRWRGGLQQRASGGRAHPFFQIGKITQQQIDLLAQLGYQYQAPVPLPWWPSRAMSSCAG